MNRIIKKASIYTLYFTVLAYIFLVLFSLTSCSSDDNQGPPTIAIPDANFEQALIDLGFDTNGANGNILQTEAEQITFLDVHSRNISSLEGIEGFTNLEALYCFDNQLTTLDVSNNLKLDNLECFSNQISSLDVSHNLALESLNCGNNALTSLNVSHNLDLLYLSCFQNQLTSLDISNNLALERLSCNGNELSVLDVSANTVLNRLLCFYNNLESLNVKNGNNINVSPSSFNATNNLNLTCIEVDDVEYSTNNWLLVDNTATYSNDCN